METSDTSDWMSAMILASDKVTFDELAQGVVQDYKANGKKTLK